MSTHYAVDLCNAALVLLGQQPVSSLDEATDAGRLCRALYGPTRDAVLRAHPWSCARTRAVLDPVAEAPAFGYAYGFLLPADCLRVLSVAAGAGPGALPGAGPGGPSSAAAGPGGVCYAVEGRRLLAMAAPVRLVYVAGGDAVDETLWDAALREALTTALAARLAYPVTQSAALGQSLEAKFQQLLREARAANAAEQPAAPVAVESPALAARSGFGGGFGGSVGVGPAGAWWQRSWLVPSEPR